jgi:hypothetical protein
MAQRMCEKSVGTPIRIRSGISTKSDVRFYRVSDEVSSEWITVCDLGKGTSNLIIGTGEDNYRIAGMLLRSGEGPGFKPWHGDKLA